MSVKCGVVEQSERGWLGLGAAAFRLPRDELERASIYLAALGPRWAVVSGEAVG